MAGSSGSGEDIESGRTNDAESTTVFQGGRPSELNVGFAGLAVFEAGPRRDDQRPDATLNGVLGRGWNGSGSPAQLEAGAGVIGVGAPNRGPGLVGLGGGLRISSTFLGSPGNLGEDGLGGTGVVGMGGDGAPTVDATAADVAATAGSRPGVGVVGQGGTSFFDPATADIGNGAGLVGIAGGRQRSPDTSVAGGLSQTDLGATANMGVVGFGGDGPKAVGSASIGPTSAGAGVRGVGGAATAPTTGAATGGPGVVGLAGGASDPGDAALADMGVAGFSTSGAGVVGTSRSSAGVAGNSTSGVGGSFLSRAVAQVHLEPHPTPLNTPNGTIRGRMGDLLVLTTTRDQQIATLWFCRKSGDEMTAVWVNIA